MLYTEPRAKILKTYKEGDVAIVVISFDRVPNEPVVPAGLYVDGESSHEVYQLHSLVSIEDKIFTFETYNSECVLPSAGQILSYRGWWVQEAMDAFLDKNTNWDKKEYPENDDHTHCLFTFERIASDCDNNIAYFSDDYGWITIDSYKRFIVDDEYRIRKNINNV